MHYAMKQKISRDQLLKDGHMFANSLLFPFTCEVFGSGKNPNTKNPWTPWKYTL